MKNLFTNINLKATPTDPEHIVNKDYVDKLMNRKIKDAVRVVMTANFAGDYADKAITQATAEELVIDGVTVEEGDRILLAGQTDATQNGIYAVTTLGTASVQAVLTRAEDFNDSAEIVPNCIVPVMEGEQNEDTQWWLVNDTVVTLDSTSLTFAKFPGTSGTVKIFSTTITGDGAATSFTVSHGLNSNNPIVQIYDNTTHEESLFGIEVTSANVVMIKADTVLTAEQSFDVVVMA